VNGPLYLGLDVGGTKCAAVLGDANGAVVDRVQWPTDASRGPDAVIADLINHGRRLLDVRGGDVRSAGVAIGGPLDADAGVVLSPPNLPGWDRIPLRDRLVVALGRPVTVMHDATACALAEYRWGAGRGCRRLVYLTCGTGFGAGLVFDGRPYSGAGGRPGDVGHVRLVGGGPFGYGRAGTAEGSCAAAALGRLAAWMFPARWPGGAEPGPANVAALATAGDADAAAVIARNAAAVGQVAAVLADVLYPDAILLGSLARYLGSEWVAAVRATFTAEAMPDAARLCRIQSAALGERLQDCSALAAAAWAAE